jgi:hypothetical protein
MFYHKPMVRTLSVQMAWVVWQASRHGEEQASLGTRAGWYERIVWGRNNIDVLLISNRQNFQAYPHGASI